LRVHIQVTIPYPKKKQHNIFTPTHNPIMLNIENNDPFYH
jgi:hypothetical protein